MNTKRLIFLMAITWLAFAASVNAQTKVTILNTNDTHSCIFPLSPTLADTTVAGRGGFLRRVKLIRQQREQAPDLLLFDSGDFSQGSPYYTLFKGDVEVGLMNRMKYDAATIGNHEFDFGLDNMARLFKMANFPIVCANYDFTGTVLEGIVKPYVVIERNGLRFGVFGLGTPLKGMVDDKNCQGVTYLNPVETTKKIVQTLRGQEKCDIVICLSHQGWKTVADNIDDQRVIPHISGVDFVLGGHTHTLLRDLQKLKDAKGKTVYVDQNGKHGIHIGKTEFIYSK